MRIDKLQEREAEKRRGSTGRTIVQFIWLLIAIGLSYAFTQFLFSEGHLSANLVYNRLLIPRAVPLWVLKGGIIFVMVVIIQFFLFLGYAVANPRGRARSGRASAYSDDPDPFDDHRG